MPIGTPQSLGASTQIGSSPLSIAITHAIQAGDLVLVGIVYETSTNPISGISDGANTYARVFRGTNGGNYELWACQGALAVSQGTNITVTLGGGSINDVVIGAARCSGLRTSSAVDVTNTTVNASVSTGVLSQATELVIGFVGGYNMTAITEDASFTNLNSTEVGADQVWLNLAYKVVASTTSVNYAPSLTGAHNSIITGVATFLPIQALNNAQLVSQASASSVFCSIPRGNPIFNVTEGVALAVQNAVNSLRSWANTETVSVVEGKQILKKFSLPETLSIRRNQSIFGALAVLMANTQNLFKFSGHAIGFSEPLVLVFNKAAGKKPFAMTNAEILTRSLGPNKLAVISQNYTITIRRNLVKLVAVLQALIVTTQQLLSGKTLIHQPNSASLNKSMVHTIPQISSAEIVLALKTALKPIALMTNANVALLVRTTQKLLQVTQAQVITLGRNLIKVIGVVQSQTVLCLHFLSHIIVLVSANLQTLFKTVLHRASLAAMPLGSLLIKGASKLFTVTMPLVDAGHRRTVLKLIRPLWPQLITVFHPHRKLLNITEGQTVRALKRMSHAISVAFANTLTAVKRDARLILVTLAEMVTTNRPTAKHILVQQPEHWTVARSMGRTIRAFLAETVRLLRGMSHKVSVTSGETVSLLTHGVHIFHQVITVIMTEAVTEISRRGKFAVTTIGQNISVVRQTGKYLLGLLGELVTLAPNGVVRKLPPSLFAFGLFRNRIVYEASNVSSTNVLDPPIEPAIEFENVAFDYGMLLDDTAQISSGAVTVTVYDGIDPNPSNILISYPVVATSPRTGKTDQAVVQEVGQTVAGVVYRLQCAATTNDGQVLVLTALLKSQASNS